jgi:hypothetical protein
VGSFALLMISILIILLDKLRLINLCIITEIHVY